MRWRPRTPALFTGSIQLRLIGSYLLLIFFSTVVTFALFVPRIQAYLVEQGNAHLRQQSQILGSFISNNYGSLDGNLILVTDDLKQTFQSIQGMRVSVFDAAGGLVADLGPATAPQASPGGEAGHRSAARPPKGSEPASPPAGGEAFEQPLRQALDGVQVTWIEGEHEQVLHVTNPLRAPGHVFGAVDLATPLGAREAVLTIRRLMGWSMLVSLLTSWIVAWLLAQTIVRPLARIRSTALQIAEGELAVRAPQAGRDELAHLGRAINHMATQLESRINEILDEKIKMSSLLDALVDGVVAFDSGNNVVFLNHVAETVVGTRSDEAMGRPLGLAFDHPALLELLAACAEQNAPASSELQLGSSTFKVFVTPFKDHRSVHQGAMMVLRDVTDLRRLEEARQLFFGAVSHELRTPLTIIKGFVVTLQDHPLASQDPEVAHSLELMDREADRLSRLVNDIIELSALRTRKMTLELRPVAAEQHVADTLSVLALHAERQGVRLESRLAAESTQIVADPDRFRQIVLNLVDNAIKYTQAGGSVCLRSHRHDRRWVLEVEDTGIGIPADELPFLFERFFRSKDKKRRAAAQGSGLGMAIVKELLDAHGAEVEIDSEVGRGTRVRVIFHVKNSAAPSPAAWGGASGGDSVPMLGMGG